MAISNLIEMMQFYIAADRSIISAFEALFSLCSLGIYRVKNDDFISGVKNPDAFSSYELKNLFIVNSTIRMLFLPIDFTHD